MKTENITLVKLIASNGMILTDGESYGKEVYLGVNDSTERWSEIPESEVPNLDEKDISEEENKEFERMEA